MKSTFGFLLLIVLAIALFVLYSEYSKREARAPIVYSSATETYYCASGTSYSVRYDRSGDYAQLSFSGTQYELVRQVSDVSTQYVDAQNGVTFSESSDTGYLKLPSDQRELICATRAVSDPVAKQIPMRINVPVTDTVVTSPMEVRGEARGFWYEGDQIVVRARTVDGAIAGQSFVTATEDSATEGFVSFAGTLSFGLPSRVEQIEGDLVFSKANPSGLPQNDEMFGVPVIFSTTDVGVGEVSTSSISADTP